MSTQKRERELAKAKYERQQQRRNERAAVARRNQRIAAVVVVGALVLAGVGWAVVNSSSDGQETVASDTSAADSVETDATEAVDQSSEDPAGGESGVLDCSAPGTARADDIQFPDGPQPLTSVSGEPTSLLLDTNCGQIAILLDPAAPETVASEAFLAESGFYDNTACHRLTTEGIYVLQCGDPAGNGTGGPGYAVPDENLPPEQEANYPAGTIAMANAGPGTGGSQFFIVYEDTTLPSGYTIWGQVVSGLDIVQEVASAGVEGGASDGAPPQPVFINKATVS